MGMTTLIILGFATSFCFGFFFKTIITKQSEDNIEMKQPNDNIKIKKEGQYEIRSIFS